MQYILTLLVFVVLTLLCVVIIRFFVTELKQTWFGYGVPFVPSADFKIEELLKNLELKKWQRFLDIGCWDGKILEAVKRKSPNNEVIGIENSPSPYKKALKRKQENGLDYTIIRWNFFKKDWSKYDIIHTYMMNHMMKRIRKKIQKECKNGTIFYSNAFAVKWVEPEKIIKIEKWKYQSRYLIYKVKK